MRKTFLSIMKVFSITGLTTFLLMIATTNGVGYEVSSDLISRTYFEESDPVRAQWDVSRDAKESSIFFHCRFDYLVCSGENGTDYTEKSSGHLSSG